MNTLVLTETQFLEKVTTLARARKWLVHHDRGDYRVLRRFFDKVIEGADGCWLWTGAKTKRENGYGCVVVEKRRYVAHRWLYEQFVGSIPDALTLDHLCRVRLCVNPDHLEPVTQRENTLRGVGLTAQQARQTQCKNGHPLSGSNLYTKPNGGRQCRTCHRKAKRRYKQRQRTGR